MKTASIHLKSHDLLIWAEFLKQLEELDVGPDVSVKGILTHEVGHYHVYPHDFATQLYMLTVADQQFGGSLGGELFLYYADIVVNTDCLRSDIRRPEVGRVYGALGRRKDAALSDRLVIGLYQEQVGVDLDVRLDGEEKKLVKELKGIDYTSPWNRQYAHATSLISFGSVMKDVLSDQMRKAGEERKKIIKKIKEKKLGPVPPEEEMKRLAQMLPRLREYQAALQRDWPIVLDNYFMPLLTKKPQIVLKLPYGCCGGLDGYSDSDINDALDDVIRRFGKIPYEMVRDYIRKERPGFTDRFKEERKRKSSKQAGIEGIENIQWNDDQIPYYKRLAATYGLYIAKKPMKDDAEDAYPLEQEPFGVGDEFRKINPWSSPIILPGITQRWEDAKARKTAYGYRVPDLHVMQDSSGSMVNPRFLSHAVLTSFVLGRNYHANGSNVGITNFSADVVIAPPERDIELFCKIACAYWGGGTVLNIEKIREYFWRLAEKGEAKVEVSTEADYRKLMESLNPAERRMFEEKRVEVNLDRRIRDVYERLDNVLITDGAIYNISEVVEYLNSIAEDARNTIFLINSPQEYKEWKKLGLERTTIYPVDRPEDLLGLSIGVVRSLAAQPVPMGKGRR